MPIDRFERLVAAFFSRSRLTGQRRQPRKRRPVPAWIEPLEGRFLLSTFVVNSLADNGTAGTLRWAVQQATSGGGSNDITFSSGLAGTITLDPNRGALELTGGVTTIQGPGANLLTLNGNGTVQLFVIDQAANATISGLTITGGGGGYGGAIANSGTLVLSSTAITASTARIYFPTGNFTSGWGGGIPNQSTGTLTLTGCTVSGNTAVISGGGIENAGALTLTDTTISGNNVLGNTSNGNSNAGGGGGLELETGATAVVNDCTIAGNKVSGFITFVGGGSGGGIDNHGSVTLNNTIVAGNTAFVQTPGDTFVLSEIDVGGSLAANSSYNFIGDGSGGLVNGTGGATGNILGNNGAPVDAKLGSLAFNGGPTQTLALLSGSPAIDAGGNALIPAGVTTDQRGSGFPRIVHGTVDIGAFETVAPAGNPTLQVSDHGQTFSAGQTATSTADGTDLGSANAPQGSTTSTFTLTNANGGSAALNLGAISVVGADPADFSATAGVNGLLAGSSTALTVTFHPTRLGTRTATIQIASNDPAYPTFTFNVTAYATTDLFDESYYLAQNPDVAANVGPGKAFASGYEHFLQFGQLEGRQPDPYFNEAFYVAHNPDLVSSVGPGKTYSFGFEEFVLAGQAAGRTFNPFYNEAFYLQQNSDVVAATGPVGSGKGFVSGFEHFLIYGQKEGRTFSRLFDVNTYLALNPTVATAVSGGAYKSGFEQFEKVGFNQGLAFTAYFDEAYYLAMNPDVAAAEQANQFASGYEHFLAYGIHEGRQYNPSFGEANYLALNPDVAAAVQSGSLRSGLQHYALDGQYEARVAQFDEAYYLFRYPDVQAAVNAHGFTSGLQHFMLFGRDEGRQPVPQVLTGASIGTAGSWSNLGNTRQNAFDGNTSTFFDGPDASGDWSGLDLGSAAAVYAIRLVPRPGFAGRMVNGLVQGSTTADFSTGVVTLDVISATPSTGWNEVILSNSTPFRYLRYIGPADSYGNVAEVQFLG